MSVPKPRVIYITLCQTLLLAAISTGLATLNIEAALPASVAAGGLIAIVPQAYFGYRVFKYTGALATQLVAQSFYSGQFGKLVLTVTGFMLAFVLLKPIHGAALFSSFIGMTVIHWIGSWWLIRARKPG